MITFASYFSESRKIENIISSALIVHLLLWFQNAYTLK